MDEHEEIRSGPGRVVWLVVALSLAAVTLTYAFIWRTQQANKATHESQRQDFALCVAQNAARAQTRLVAASTYSLVASILRSGGPGDPALRPVFRHQEHRLAKQLDALRPLDCDTYVRPDIPPDRGVG